MMLWTSIFALATLLIYNEATLTATNRTDSENLLSSYLIEQFYNSGFGRNYNSTVFENFLNLYLDGLMVRYRSRVLDIHRRLACENGSCDLFETEKSMNQILKVVAIQKQFSFIVSGEITTVAKQENYANSDFAMAFGARGQTGFRIVKLQGPPYLFKYYNDKLFLNYETICNSSAIYFHEMWVLVTGSCEVISGQSIVRVFMEDENKNIMFVQLLILKRLKQVLLFKHEKQLLMLATSSDAHECLLLCLRNTEFQACGKTNIAFNHVKTVALGMDTFLIAIDEERKRHIHVYKLTQRTNSHLEFKLHQVIQECSSINFEISVVGGISFIAVACLHSESRFLWWSGSQYLLWQIIPLSKNILTWTSLIVEDQTFLAAQESLKSTGVALSVYQFEEGYFRKVDNVSYYIGIVSVKEIVAFRFRGDYFLTIVSNNTENSLETLKLEMKITDEDFHIEDENNECVEKTLEEIQLENHEIDKLRLQSETLMNEQQELIKNVSNRLKDLEENIASYERITHDILRKIPLNGTIHLKTLTVLEKTEISTVSGSVRDFDIVHLNKWALSKTRSQMINRRVKINGKIRVDHLKASGMLNDFKLTNDNIATAAREVIFTKPQLFKASVHALNVFVKGKVNGIHLSNVVLRNSRQVISGEKRVEQLVVRGNLFLNKLNMIKFDELKRQFVTLTGTQTILGRVLFQQGFAVNGRLDCKIVNGVHFSNWAKRVLTIDTPQVITGKFIFEAPQTIERATLLGFVNGIRITPETVHNSNQRYVMSRLSERSTSFDGSSSDVINHFGDLTVDVMNTDFINGIDVNFLLNSLMRKSRNQNLEGFLKFEEAVFDEIYFDDNINGHRNLQDDFLTVATDQNISTPLAMSGKVAFHKSVHLPDGVKINGVDLSELDAISVQNGGHQVIHGHKEFAGDIIVQNVNAVHEFNLNASVILVNGDLIIKENLQTDTINGRNVDKLFSEAITIDNCKISGNIHFLKGFQVKRLDWYSKINKVDVPNFLSNIIRLSSDDVITGEVHFEDAVTFASDVQVQMVNNKIFNEQISKIAQVDTEGKLTHNVIFRNDLFVSGNVKVDILNGKRFSDFKNSVISKLKDQKLPGLKSIYGNISADYLDPFGTINDVHVSDLVDINDGITFTNKFDFQSFLEFNSLNVDGNVHHPNTEKLDNVTIEEEAHFDEIRTGKVVMEKLVDGVHLQNAKDKVLSKSIPQILNVDVAFENDVFIDHLTVQSEILENPSKFQEDYISSRQVFDTNTTLRFHRGLIIDDINEEHKVSNISWLETFSGSINSNVVFNGGIKIKGKIKGATFSKNLNTKRLEVAETINNIPVSRFEFRRNLSSRIEIEEDGFSCWKSNFENSSDVLNHSDCRLALQKTELSLKNDVEYLEMMTRLDSCDDISVLKLGSNRILLLLHHLPRKASDKCSNLVAYKCDWHSGVPSCQLDAEGAPPGTYNVIKTRYLQEKRGGTKYTVFLNGENPTDIDDCYHLSLAQEAAIVVVQTPRILLTSFALPTKAASDVTLIEGSARGRTYLIVSSFQDGLGVFLIANVFPRYKVIQRLNSEKWKINTVVGVEAKRLKFVFALNAHAKIGSEMLIVFNWDDKAEKLVEFRNIAVPFARDVSVFYTVSGQVYMIVAEQDRISIHEFDGKGTRLVQSIAERTLRISTIKFGDVTYLTWVSEGEILHLWFWDDIFHAVEVSRVQIRKARNVHAFIAGSELWMALAVSFSSQAALDGSHSQSNHHSVIFRGAAFSEKLQQDLTSFCYQ